MINFNSQRSTAVVYSCGVCNLNCRYCTIDKNPVLKDIDNELEESFKGDYYFNRIKEYFPRYDQLHRLETWGGEPFLRMDRVYPLVHKLIEHYPYFNEMFSSTNFSYDSWLDQFMGLMRVFEQYPYREFKYELQLSVDGPPYINDTNRGAGVTERCIKNFDKLINIIKEGKFPKNVVLDMYIKGTWDIEAIHRLNDKEKLIEFFQFYEQTYLLKASELNKPNIIVGCGIPNVAIPSPVTKHDGEVFAELVKKCREIEEENLTHHYFKLYDRITPFTGKFCSNYGGMCDDCFGCGSGGCMVGFLPNNMVSACHEGFTLLVDNYKKFAMKRSDENLSVNLNKFFELNTTPMCLTDEGYVEHERKMDFISNSSPVQVANTVLLIMTLAMSGLVDQKYINEGMALFAAKTILVNSSYCIKANYAMTGSFILEPTDTYILLLNGALEYINGGEDNECTC